MAFEKRSKIDSPLDAPAEGPAFRTEDNMSSSLSSIFSLKRRKNNVSKYEGKGQTSSLQFQMECSEVFVTLFTKKLFLFQVQDFLN